jgi:GNAT superfamily N-acetyltransferase
MTLEIELLDEPDEHDVRDLAHVLVDCVEGGASVNFVAPLPMADAVEWWHAALEQPHALTWAARGPSGRIVGCVRLVLAQQDNGQHRAEVSKLLVSTAARRTGCAAALMAALESWAEEHGRHRLVLDTETGSPAEEVYERLGWTRVGTIPDYALTSSGELCGSTIFTKSLLPRAAGGTA